MRFGRTARTALGISNLYNTLSNQAYSYSNSLASSIATVQNNAVQVANLISLSANTAPTSQSTTTTYTALGISNLYNTLSNQAYTYSNSLATAINNEHNSAVQIGNLLSLSANTAPTSQSTCTLKPSNNCATWCPLWRT